ncbi:YihY/virulence factor BrkB family protein [Brachybacterium saurashtrense]|uniref:YihY/virulence factor BrkB family protein n=1 Tax=Brachybacterium saurashtrense TaxID=556288 RepID=A0A345YNJ7_9MICO|nr:YihY/virulence factor BrkB family protein [Brachybacterium saurashtrense]AXK45499.1 YihY/virulence factor BrkB family protein [Brachybacterium saurashtrense]RRR21129.1 YihY/virulence factor BrkB family protein [Brachybacterium saurashtrense]
MAASSSRRGTDAPRLTGTLVLYMAKRVLAEFVRDGGTDQAAKLTYFMVLSIAPTLLALFSLATLVLKGIKDQIADLLVDAINSAAGGSGLGAEDAVRSTLDSLLGSTTGGTIALIIGIGTALWSASAYIKAYSRAANHIYELPEGRGPIRMNATMLALTVAMILGILLIMVSILLSESIVEGLLGPIASSIGAQGALSFLLESFLPIWAWVKWPVILVIAFALISLLFWGAPNLRKPFRFISPGGVFAILGVAVAAVALSIYMTTVAGYSSYGAIGGIMAVLFALWVINIVIIMGAEVDAEYERARELAAGKPAEDSLALPMRGARGAEKAEAKHQKLVDRGRDIRLQNLHHDAEAYLGEDARLTPRHGVPVVPAGGADGPEGRGRDRDRDA